MKAVAIFSNLEAAFTPSRLAMIQIFVAETAFRAGKKVDCLGAGDSIQKGNFESFANLVTTNSFLKDSHSRIHQLINGEKFFIHLVATPMLLVDTIKIGRYGHNASNSTSIFASDAIQ
jgi:hypothetical protein